MTRTDARELLMQMVFQMEIQRDYSEEAKQLFLEDKPSLKEQTEYFEELYSIIVSHKEEINQAFEKSSKSWKLDRLPKVDLAIIRIAIAEILFCENIPAVVSINEAVDLAKKYGTDDSFKFINGVLGKIIKE